MKEQNAASPERRTEWIKIRVTPQEKSAIAALAENAGMECVSDFIRTRCLNYRIRESPLNRDFLLQQSRIGSNLNQLARWANTYAKNAEGSAIIKALLEIDRELRLQTDTLAGKTES